MDTPPGALVSPPRELLIVGGRPALDFANTIDDPGGRAHFDHLADGDRLLSWARQAHLIDETTAERLGERSRAEPDTTASGVRRAHDLRHALQTVFGCVVDGYAIDPVAWRRLREFAASAVEHLVLRPAPEGVEATWPEPQALSELFWPVAHDALDLLTSDLLPRVKRCPTCPWLFLDRSKNRSRRWCTMADCGGRSKMDAYVARRAARRRS